jgi:hypothetical protein
MLGCTYLALCELYRAFEKTLSVTMRQTHAAGESLFVDYAGDGVPVVVDRLTGEIRVPQIFVAVLGASSFSFAKATRTQALPDWIDATSAPSRRSAASPNLLCPTIRRPPSSGLASMTRRSAAHTPRWRNLLKHPTLDLLHALGLHGMARAFADMTAADQAKDLPHADWLAPLLDRETSWRRDKRLTTRLRAAKLRQQAGIEDVDYAPLAVSTASCSRSSRTANGSAPTIISLSSARAASARAGSLAPSARRLAATTLFCPLARLGER